MKKLKIKKTCEGVISIMLALMLLPFLSVIAVVVEGVRIQEAKASLVELMQFSGYSTLANYDSELLDRFGLLAVNQASDAGVDDIFQQYLLQNTAGSSAVSVKEGGISASGKLPLSDIEIMRNQIFEYSKFRTPINFAAGALNIDEFFEELESAFKGGTDALEKVSAGADALSTVAELIKKLQELDEAIKALNEAQALLPKLYDTFKTAVTSYITFLEEEEKPEDPGLTKPDPPGPDATEQEKSDYEKEKKAYDEAMDAYLAEQAEYDGKKLQHQTAINDAKTAYADALKPLQGSDNLIQKAKKAFDDMKKEHDALGVKVGAVAEAFEKSETGKEALGDAQDYAEKLFQKTGDIVTGLQNLAWKPAEDAYTSIYPKVNGFVASAVTEKSVFTEADYWYEGLGLVDIIDVLVEALTDALEEMKSDPLKDLFGCITGIFGAMGDLTLFYDPEYSITLSEGVYEARPSKTSGVSMPQGIDDFQQAWQDTNNGLKTLQEKDIFTNTLRFLSAVKDVAVGIVKLIAAVMKVIGEKVLAFGSLIKDNVGERVVLADYVGNTMPHRLTERGELIKLGLPSGGITAPAPTGELNFTVPQLPGTEQQMFSACSQEYVLTGFKSEVVNQTLTFFDMFFLRLILNIAPVLFDKSIQKLAAGPQGVFVYIGVMLMESLVDMLFLVNGGFAPVIKSAAFDSGLTLSLEGGTQKLEQLTEQLKAIATKLGSGGYEDENEGGKDGILEGLKEGLGDYKSDYFEDLNEKEYDFYLMILLWLVPNDVKLARIGDIVQFEMSYKAKKYNKNEGFLLGKAYTVVHADVTGNYQSVFPFPDIQTGPFAIKETQDVGY